MGSLDRMAWGCVLVLLVGAAACGDDDVGTPADAGPMADTGAPDVDGSPPDGDGGSPADDAGGPPTGGPDSLPSPTGTCPDFADGTLTFNPSGIAPRDVRIWMSDAAATLDGPLVFYWHGTGGSPNGTVRGLGRTTMDAIQALGGIIAAPVHDPAAGTWPWFLVASTRDDDLRVADEVLGCAIEQIGIDTARIHSAGMSAGGIQTTQMSFRRSSYLASVATYSGGLGSPRAIPPYEDPSNLFAALIFHGGPSDVVVISFQDAGELYWSTLDGDGHFAAICDHGGGHSIPTAAHPSVWQFFQDHPWGTDPSPYEGGLPGGFFADCSLMP